MEYHIGDPAMMNKSAPRLKKIRSDKRKKKKKKERKKRRGRIKTGDIKDKPSGSLVHLMAPPKRCKPEW